MTPNSFKTEKPKTWEDVRKKKTDKNQP